MILASRLPDAYSVGCNSRGYRALPFTPGYSYATLSRASHCLTIENIYKTHLILNPETTSFIHKKEATLQKQRRLLGYIINCFIMGSICKRGILFGFFREHKLLALLCE